MTASTPTWSSSEQSQELLDEFLIDAKLQGLSEGTLDTYGSQLQYFIDWTDTDLENVGKEELKRFLAHLKEDRTAIDGSTGLSISTQNSYFSALNSLFKFLTYEDHVDENPVPSFRERYLDSQPTNSGSERQLISIEEMSMLVHSTLDPRN